MDAVIAFFKDQLSDDDFEVFQMFQRFRDNDMITDLVVDFDEVYAWLGFRSKTEARRLLAKSCKKGSDYTSTRSNAKETVMLTPYAFKVMCILSGTDKGKQVRTYLRNIEELFMKQHLETLVQTSKPEVEVL